MHPWLSPSLLFFGPCPSWVARHPIFPIPLTDSDSQQEPLQSCFEEEGLHLLPVGCGQLAPWTGMCILRSLKSLSPPFVDSPELGIQVGTSPGGRSGQRDIAQWLWEHGEIVSLSPCPSSEEVT